MAAESTYAEAIRYALEDGMSADPSIILFGQDIRLGFPWGITLGLAAKYGDDRVRDTPISEAGTMGCAIGTAVGGMHPVVEYDFAGFFLLALDQLVNNAAKLRFMSGGQLRVPLVVRVGQGAMGSLGAQHTHVQHAMLVATPGLSVCVPSTPQSAYDLMRWSLRQRDPVVYAEDVRLYRSKGPVERREAPIERTIRRRRGTDVTVIGFGRIVPTALEAAERLAGEGVELEVVDVQLLSPMGREEIAASCRATGRVICVGDDPLLGGITATLAAVVGEESYGDLRAPVVRLGAQHSPSPYSPDLERAVFPTAEAIATAARALMDY